MGDIGKLQTLRKMRDRLVASIESKKHTVAHMKAEFKNLMSTANSRFNIDTIEELDAKVQELKQEHAENQERLSKALDMYEVGNFEAVINLLKGNQQ